MFSTEIDKPAGSWWFGSASRGPGGRALELKGGATSSHPRG